MYIYSNKNEYRRKNLAVDFEKVFIFQIMVQCMANILALCWSMPCKTEEWRTVMVSRDVQLVTIAVSVRYIDVQLM